MMMYQYPRGKGLWTSEIKSWSDEVAAASIDELSVEHQSNLTENCRTHDENDISKEERSAMKEFGTKGIVGHDVPVPVRHTMQITPQPKKAFDHSSIKSSSS